MQVTTSAVAVLTALPWLMWYAAYNRAVRGWAWARTAPANRLLTAVNIEAFTLTWTSEHCVQRPLVCILPGCKQCLRERIALRNQSDQHSSSNLCNRTRDCRN